MFPSKNKTIVCLKMYSIKRNDDLVCIGVQLFYTCSFKIKNKKTFLHMHQTEIFYVDIWKDILELTYKRTKK